LCRPDKRQRRAYQNTISDQRKKQRERHHVQMLEMIDQIYIYSFSGYQLEVY